MNLPDHKDTLKAYDAFISDGVGWANEVTETGHQLFLIGESAKAKEMYYLALSMHGDCEEQTILAEHAFQDLKDLDLTQRCLEEAELAWLKQIISFSDSDHTELSDIIVEYSKDSHSQLVSSKVLETIDKSYDWEKSLIFYSDDNEGSAIGSGTPIGQARDFRERIIKLKVIAKL